MYLILLVVLVLLLIGALPTWQHSAGWGYYPSGGLGLVVTVILVLYQLAEGMTLVPTPPPTPSLKGRGL